MDEAQHQQAAAEETDTIAMLTDASAVVDQAVLKQKTAWLLLAIWFWAKKTSNGVTKTVQESRAVAGNPRDAAVIFDP